MTPEPVALVVRSRCRGALKKRRKNGSLSRGLSVAASAVRARTAMLTTPGVISSSIGARLGTPPISGGMAARLDGIGGVTSSAARTSIRKCVFVIVEPLRRLAAAAGGGTPGEQRCQDSNIAHEPSPVMLVVLRRTAG